MGFNFNDCLMINWKFFLPAIIIVVVIGLATVIKVPDTTASATLITTPAATATPTIPKPTVNPTPLTPVGIIDSSVQTSLTQTIEANIAPDPADTAATDAPVTESVDAFDKAVTISSDEI
jgi:hypothetical protein